MLLFADTRPFAHLATVMSPMEIAFEIQVHTGLTYSEAHKLYGASRDALSVQYAPNAYPDHDDADARRIIAHAIAAS
jgi:hypothetical protein